MAKTMTGAEMVLQALKDQGVDTIFGYPGGAVLPIYDKIFKQNEIRHVLVRHEQGATHAAEGYARSTGKPGVVLVTSGPGATNAVTGMTDALMDSVPMVVLSGQVPTFMIGNDAFQEADTVGITRPCTKHNWLVKETDKLSNTIHEAFHVATSGRPGPVLIDIPKDVQFASGEYTPPDKADLGHYQPQVKGDMSMIEALVELMETAERPIIYSGGGVINSGPAASRLLRELVAATNFPITSTLMGLGCYPASGDNWLGMLGMHGTYEANMTMHGCDLMINVGARFDDRITGRVDAFSPEIEESPYRHRPVFDQQGDPCRCSDHRRCRPHHGSASKGLEIARPQDKRRSCEKMAYADRRMEIRQLPPVRTGRSDHQTSTCADAAGGFDQRHGSLYHDRCGSASNVGGAISGL